MKINVIERLKYIKMFRKYMDEYGEKYSEDSRNFLSDNFLKITEPGRTPDILAQLYANFGMLSEEENIYLEFCKIIGDIYGWDRNILEVGGGYYPIFSKYVDDKQTECGSGTITVIDPKLVTGSLGNVKLVKEEFSRESNVSDFNLLIGICPCESTIDIISSALINQKEFFIALCGCVPYPYNCMPFLSPYAAHIVWSENIKELAYEQEESGFEVITKNIDNFPYPIIYSKRKK